VQIRVGTLEYRTLQIITHPNSNSTNMVDFDIALIEAEKFRGNGEAVPICISDFDPAVNMECSIAGYGAEEYQGEATGSLYEAYLPIASDENCIAAYNATAERRHLLPDFNMKTQICAGYENGQRDACTGDSGGPLMCKPVGTCSYYIAGVVSWGHKCGDTYGVYARFSAFRDWVKSTIGPDLKPDQIPNSTPTEICNSECDAIMSDVGIFTKTDKSSRTGMPIFRAEAENQMTYYLFLIKTEYYSGWVISPKIDIVEFGTCWTTRDLTSTLSLACPKGEYLPVGFQADPLHLTCLDTVQLKSAKVESIKLLGIRSYLGIKPYLRDFYVRDGTRYFPNGAYNSRIRYTAKLRAGELESEIVWTTVFGKVGWVLNTSNGTMFKPLFVSFSKVLSPLDATNWNYLPPGTQQETDMITADHVVPAEGHLKKDDVIFPRMLPYNGLRYPAMAEISQSSRCDVGWTEYIPVHKKGREIFSKCFRYFRVETDKMNGVVKPYASRECFDQEAKLLGIQNEAENTFFDELATTKNWRAFWLVVNDSKNEGQWIKPEKIGAIVYQRIISTFVNFADEPDDTLSDDVEDSAIFLASGETHGKWADVTSGELHDFVCEKPLKI